MRKKITNQGKNNQEYFKKSIKRFYILELFKYTEVAKVRWEDMCKVKSKVGSKASIVVIVAKKGNKVMIDESESFILVWKFWSLDTYDLKPYSSAVY